MDIAMNFSWGRKFASEIMFEASRFSEKQRGLERGPLSLVRTTEELLERKSSGSGL
jgi:hypothetical protein